VYFVLCWRIGGQTLPMKTWNIRLVDGDGGKLPLWKAVVRYVISWPITLSGAGFIWTFIDRDRQFPHDRLLNTRLVTTA
jgi:uncharacterized RDD family membrane protein YckC